MHKLLYGIMCVRGVVCVFMAVCDMRDQERESC